MGEERKRILDMLANGKISADEAMKLIKALEEAPVEAEIEVIETEAGSRSEFERVLALSHFDRNRFRMVVFHRCSG